jgi:ribonuclease Z
VNPIEIPTSRLLDESPDDIPIYKDDHISVFALPVSAEIQSQEASGSVTLSHPETSVDNRRSGKRKRSPSPDAPPLQEFISHPDFDPTTLVGKMAQDWLRYIVRTMFPGSAAKPVVSSEKIEHVSQPSGFNCPLPSLPSCNQRATLAYAVVGPRVRGKFDVKRAEVLGLKAGPLRARVAKGETVIVMGQDGVERSVGPSDVVGTSEVPGVRFLSRYVSSSRSRSVSRWADRRITGRVDTGRAQHRAYTFSCEGL